MDTILLVLDNKPLADRFQAEILDALGFLVDVEPTNDPAYVPLNVEAWKVYLPSHTTPSKIRPAKAFAKGFMAGMSATVVLVKP